MDKYFKIISSRGLTKKEKQYLAYARIVEGPNGYSIKFGIKNSMNQIRKFGYSFLPLLDDKMLSGTSHVGTKIDKNKIILVTGINKKGNKVVRVTY